MDLGRVIRGVIGLNIPDLKGVQYLTVDVADDKGMSVFRKRIMFP